MQGISRLTNEGAFQNDLVHRLLRYICIRGLDSVNFCFVYSSENLEKRTDPVSRNRGSVTLSPTHIIAIQTYEANDIRGDIP
jgi:hypothetical protein